MQVSTKIAVCVVLVLVAFHLEGCDDVEKCKEDVSESATEAKEEVTKEVGTACAEETPTDEKAVEECKADTTVAVAEAVEETEKKELEVCEGKEEEADEAETPAEEAGEAKKIAAEDEADEKADGAEETPAATTAAPAATTAAPATEAATTAAPAATTAAPATTPVARLYEKARNWRPRRKARRATFGSLTTLGGAAAGCVLLAVAVGGYALGVRRQRVPITSDGTELLQDTENQVE